MCLLVEVPHTYFTKVTWMVFVKVDAMVMLTTGITTTTGMLTVLSNTTVTVTHVAPEFSCLTKSGRL